MWLKKRRRLPGTSLSEARGDSARLVDVVAMDEELSVFLCPGRPVPIGCKTLTLSSIGSDVADLGLNLVCRLGGEATGGGESSAARRE